MPEEFDDFGIPIKKQNVVSESDTHDEFGIPVKKKGSSVSAEPSINDSKTPSPLSGKSGEKVERQQSTSGNVIPSFDPNNKGLSPSEKQLLSDRELALKRRDKEIESRKATKFVQENTGLKSRTGSLQQDTGRITDFEKRIQDPSLYIQNENGSKSTHEMASAGVDGMEIAYPTIVNKGGKLQRLDHEQALDYALKTGEYKQFKTQQEAQQYAEGGYKKGTPLENHDAFLKTIPSLRDKNLLPSSKIKEEVIPDPKKGSYAEFERQKEKERYAKSERDRLALEEGQKDAELAKLSIADKAKSYANSFLQGGFGGLASTVNIAGTVYTKTKEAITGKKDWGSRADDEITRRTLNNFQQEYFPEANALKGSLGSQVARGFGQMGAMAATAAVTGGSAIIPSISAFAETYDSESQEALKNGASESTANKVAIANALASMGLEAVPVLRMLNRANKTTGGTTFKQIALELGKKGVKGGLEEGGTEMAQQGVSNLIAQKTYDKKRELGSGIAESGGVGGIIGFTSTISLSALGVSLKNAKTPKEKAEIESQIADLEGLKNEAIAKEQKQIDSKKAEILASLEPDGNGGVIMTPEAKVELDKLENASVQVQEPTQQSATITEGEKPSAFASKQQESDGKPVNTEDNKGATIESAIIEIGGQTFEGKNHAEAILKAQQAGKDISKVDRQGEGMFKLSDGTIINRGQALQAFGANKAEQLIAQDEDANEANKEYEKVKREFKREDIANKIALEDASVIADIPIEDVPLLYKVRTKTENAPITTPVQEDIALTVQQPTITGAQKQEGATGVQAVSENVQETGATDAESVPISQEKQNIALQDVNSTAKALEGKNPEKLIPLFDVLGEVQDSESNKQQAIRVIDLEINILPDDIKHSKDQERIEQLQQRLDYLSDPKNKEKEVESLFKELEKYSSEKLANSSKRVSEAYHKAKANGKNPELVKAVESLLGEQNKITNEPTTIQEVENPILADQPPTPFDEWFNQSGDPEFIPVNRNTEREIYNDTPNNIKLIRDVTIPSSFLPQSERTILDLNIPNTKENIQLIEKEGGVLDEEGWYVSEGYGVVTFKGKDSLKKAYEFSQKYGEKFNPKQPQNKIKNEPTQEQNVPASVLDQPRATDSDTEKGTEQVEGGKKKESKFNKRQRLGIPVNEALKQLADKDRLMYDVKTNKDLLDEAIKRIEKDIDEAYEFATQEDPKASELTGMFATAGRLIPILENAIKNSDSADAKAFWTDKLDELRKAVKKQATIGGQAVQALVTVGNIMPMRDSVELNAIAQREAIVKKGTKDGKFEESVKQGTKEDAEKIADNIINNDSKVKELEAKIIELEGKIAGKKKAKRDEATKKAIEKIDSLIGKDFAFSDPLLIASAVRKGAVVLKTLIKGQAKVADAIDKAVAHINTLTKGVKWDEAKFRATVNDQLADVRETLDELYDEKQATVKSRKQLRDSIRKGLISGDFSDLETLLKSKEMSVEDVDKYIERLEKKHEEEVVFAVYKRVQKNLGLTPSTKKVKSAVEIEVSQEPLTPEEIEARLKNQIDAVSKEVEKLKANRIEKNTATKEELEAKKKLEELEKTKKELTTGQLARKIFENEPLTESEVIARLQKKKDALDKKISDERAKRVSKNLETTAEKQARQEREKVEQSMKELSDVQIAKKIVSQEPLTPEEIEALFKKKNKIEDITKEQSEKLKQLYDEVERVSGDIDLHKEALDKLRHEAQKLVPKTGFSSFMNAYDSIWHYPSILSGHMTQIANYADALMQSFTPDMISKTGRESFKDQFRGLKSAVNKAKIGLREGFLSEGLLNNGQPDKLNLSRKTAEDFAKEGNKIAKVTKWVGRIMSVPNTFGEAIKFNALSNIIQRDLKAQGLTGRDLKDRKNELLFGTAAKMPEYEAKAVELVYGKDARDGTDVLKEAKVKRTISNLILEDMQNQMTTIEGQSVLETAERIKDIATYQNNATGLMSILPKMASSLESNKTFGEAIKFVNKKMLRIDFLNTIANIANSKLNYLPPYGYLRANNISTSRIVKWAFPQWEGMLSHPDFSKPENYEEKRRILQKANIGTMIILGVGAKALYGAIEDEDDDKNENRFITGDLTPSDIMDMASKHVHKKEVYESVPPNSIKLPVFGWTNYMLTPFAGALSVVGNWSDRMYANKHKELTAESIAIDAAWANARALKSIILDGTPLGATIESNRPSKMTTTDNALEQIAVWGMTKTADIAGSAIPNLVKSIGKQIDPTLYTPKDLPTIVVKQMGLLNWYSAMGGEIKTGYAVDLLGNKIGTRSGDRYFDLLLKTHPEDKKIYDLLMGAYKEPMNYPSLLDSNTPIRVTLMKQEEYDKELSVIKSKFEKKDITKVQMQNQLDALEKASSKDDDIGNDPLLYSQALEFCGKEFKKMLKENYDDISNTKNSNEKQNKIKTLLSIAKDLAKAKYGKPPKRTKNKL